MYYLILFFVVCFLTDLFYYMINSIDAGQLKKLNDLIAAGQQHKFYSWRAWRDHIRPYVLQLDHYECFYCHKPVNNRAAIVHHINALTDRPDLALSVYDTTGRRQLVTVCKSCHELQHSEVLSSNQFKSNIEPLTVECWQ